MNRMRTAIIIFIILILTNVPESVYAASDNKHMNKFDVKLSIENRDQYKGVVIGDLNLIKIEIKNLTDKKVRIGKYFRVLMTLDATSWNQFSMAASGETNLDSDRVSNLKYGYGANAIAKKGEDKQSIMIHIGNMNSVINDISPKSQNIEFDKWWPDYLLPKSSVTIKWPTFWFSDSADKPQFISSPSLSLNQEKYIYWVSFKNNEIREIAVNTENLIKIISDTAEPVGLRAASVVWLLEDDRKNEKHLLPYITNKQTPEALAYRAIQALMIWGSPKIIDEIYSLWKNRKLLPYLDEDMKNYFTWSSQKNAAKATKEVKAGNR